MRRSLRLTTWLVVATFGVAGLVAAPAQAAPARADLKVSTLSPATKTVETGTKLKVKVTTANTGKKQAAATKTKLVLSKDSKLSKNDKTLKTVSVGKLNKGKSVTTTVTVTLPKVTGSWRLLACADSTKRVTESSESNNCKIVKMSITPLRSDLVVSTLKPATTSPKTGASLKVAVTTKNSGKVAAAKSSTRLILSKDAKVSSGDTVLKTVAVGTLKKGASASATATVTLPKVTGTWHLIACADVGKKVKESKETNNCKTTRLTIAAATPAPKPTPTPKPTTTPAPSPTPTPTPAPSPTPTPTPAPSPTPTPTPTPSPSPDPTTDPDPDDWPTGLAVQVLVPDQPLELLPHERWWEVTVRVHNSGTSTTPAVEGVLKWSDFPAALDPWEGWDQLVAVPALAPGEHADVTGWVQFSFDTPANDVPFTLALWLEHGAYSSPVSSFDVVALGEWALPNLHAAVSLPFSEIVVSEAVTFDATVTFTNTGGGPSPEDSNVGPGLSVDCAVCWGGTGYEPIIEDFDLPYVPAGGEVVVPVEVTFPAYDGQRRSSAIRAWFESYATGYSADAHAAAMFVTPLDGRNLAVTDATLPTVVGASAERPYSFKVHAEVGNTGTQAPGDTVFVSAAILDSPSWDPEVSQVNSGVAQVEQLAVGQAQAVAIDVAWDGPPPVDPHYLVVCVNEIPEWAWNDVGADWWWPDLVPLEETTTADNCVSEQLQFVDLDAPIPPAGGPSGVFPHTPAPLAADVTYAEEPGFTGAFSWQQTTPQQWSLNVAPGVDATVAIPHGVFIEDFEITGTPVTLGGDLPLDVLGAFALDPGDVLGDGLLTVRFDLSGAAGETNSDDQVLFVADSDGSNLRVAPVVRNGDGDYSATVLTAGLDHLGIVGIGAATPTQREALAESWPEYDDQQLELVTGLATHDQRRDALDGLPFSAGAVASGGPGAMGMALGSGVLLPMAADDPNWMDKFIAQLTAQWNDKVSPAISEASAVNATELQISRAVTTYLTFARQVELMNLGAHAPFSAWVAEGDVRLHDLIDRYADKVKARCQAGQVDAVPDMMSTMRMLALWSHDSKAAELDTVLPKCSRYKVAIRVTSVEKTLQGGQLVEVQNVDMSGSWEPENGMVRGQNFTVVHWEVEGNPWTPTPPYTRIGFLVETKIKPNKRRGVGATMDFLVRFGPQKTNNIDWDISPPWAFTWLEPANDPSPYPRGDLVVGPYVTYAPPVTLKGASPYTWSMNVPNNNASGTLTASVDISIHSVPPGD